MRILLLAFSVLFFMATSSYASLISLDDPIYGPGSITLDTESGLEWLDLPLSGGLSYNQMVIELEPEGSFESFHYANFEEVVMLWASAGINCAASNGSCGGDEVSGEEAQRVIDFIALTGGPTSSTTFLALQTGVLGDRGESPPGSDLHVSSVIEYLFLDGVPNAKMHLHRALSFAADDSPQPGHWLVRVVPEPSTALLMGLGLVVLSVRRRL